MALSRGRICFTAHNLRNIPLCVTVHVGESVNFVSVHARGGVCVCMSECARAYVASRQRLGLTSHNT
jgi:hypothetical protein